MSRKRKGDNTMSTNPVPPAPGTAPAPTPTPAANAVGLATLKADAQSWATTLVNELSDKLGAELPKAQAALDAWIAKL
jgi:hypothetical protein